MALRIVPSLLTMLLLTQLASAQLPADSQAEQTEKNSTAIDTRIKVDETDTADHSEDLAAQSKQSASSGSEGSTLGDGSVIAPAVDAVMASEPRIYELGTASLLQIHPSALRLGPLAITSFEYSQIMDRVQYQGLSGISRNASVFRSNVVLDKSFRKNHFTVQYQPRLAIVNGVLNKDFTNHNLNFDTSFQVSQRMSLSVSNTLTYYATENLFEDLNLRSDISTGTALQNSYVDAPGVWKANSTSASIGYQLNGRTKLSFTPAFTWASTQQGDSSNTGRTYGISVSVNRAMNERRTVGAFYSNQVSLFSAEHPKTLYNAFGMNFSQLFGRSWSLTTSLAGSSATAGTDPRHWTFQSSATLVKSFRRSSAALAYSRSSALFGRLRSGYADRIDFNYGVSLTRKMGASIGVGDYREIWALGDTGGKYVSSQVSYQFVPMFSTFLAYTYKQQSGRTIEVNRGHRNYVAVGLKWAQVPRAAY